MFKTKIEKQEYMDKLFEDISLFEWEVMHVTSHNDRVEVMQLLAKTLVREKLKHEINFLYLKSFYNFKFSSIINGLFKEIVREWLGFTEEVLFYSQSDALKEVQDPARANFIYGIVNDYFDNYQRYIYEEIINTLIELIDSVPHANNINLIVQKVLDSELVMTKGILAVQHFDQVWRMVRTARDKKIVEISKVQKAIADTFTKLKRESLDEEKEENLISLIEKLELKMEDLNNFPMDCFDIALKRFKENMVKSMTRAYSLDSF